MSVGSKKKSAKARGSLRVAALGGAVALVGVALGVFAIRSLERDATRKTTVFRAQSCSMEPTFCGPCFLWTCPRCGVRFPMSLDVESAGGARGYSESELTAALMDSENEGVLRENEDSPEARAFLKSARSAICPHCGGISTEPPVFQDGAIVEVESEPSRTDVRRWDVVVFQDSLGRMALKRVVGLPGEQVAIVNGDVFIDGRIAPRPLDVLWRDAVRLYSLDARRSDSRVDLVHSTFVLDGDSTRAVPSPASNESPIPRWGGANVAPVELVRDFLLRFQLRRESGVPARIAVLARRPSRAFLVEYDENALSICLRSLSLFNGKTALGKTFEQLTEVDFLNEPRVSVAIEPLEGDATAPVVRVAISLVDGELSFMLNDVERARFSTEDAESVVASAISEPFAILGTVARVGSIELYRDIHYSSGVDSRRFSTNESDDASNGESLQTLTGESRKSSAGRYYLLGDNSPASIDSRFDAFGTIDRSAIVGRAKIAEDYLSR